MRMGFREFGFGKGGLLINVPEEEAAWETCGYVRQHGVFRETALNL